MRNSLVLLRMEQRMLDLHSGLPGKCLLHRDHTVTEAWTSLCVGAFAAAAAFLHNYVRAWHGSGTF